MKKKKIKPKTIIVAPQEKLKFVEDFCDEFLQKVCGTGGLVTDESRLRDFISMYFFVKTKVERDALKEKVIKKVQRIYGCNIRSVFHKPLPELMKYVQENRK